MNALDAFDEAKAAVSALSPIFRSPSAASGFRTGSGFIPEDREDIERAIAALRALAAEVS